MSPLLRGYVLGLLDTCEFHDREVETMKIRSFTAMSLAMLVSLAVLVPPASAQQKTAKACQKDWAANKVAPQASGKTEKAYIAECSGKTAKPAAAATTTTGRAYDR
jgi:hypothetical protein